MRQSRKRALYCWPILLFHFVVDVDGWVSVQSASSFLRPVTTSIQSLPEDFDEKRRLYWEDEEPDRIFAKRRKPHSRQSRPGKYAGSSVAGPHSISNHQKRQNRFRRIEGQRWQTSLFAKHNPDDSNEAPLTGKNTTTTNRKGFAHEEKPNRTALTEEPNVLGVESSSNTSSSTLRDRKSGDKKPISSVARAFAGFFGDLNATQTTATDITNSSDFPQENNHKPRSAQNTTIAQQSGDDLNVSSLVLDSENSTDNVILVTVLGSNSSLPANKNTSLICSQDLMSNSTILVEANSTNAIPLNSSSLLKAEALSSPKNVTSVNETVSVAEKLASSDTIPSELNTEATKPPVKKKPKLRVTWLDSPVKPDYNKKAFLASGARETNLTATLPQDDSTTTIGRTVQELMVATGRIPGAAASPAVDTNQTAAISGDILTSAASEINISFSSEDAIVKAIPETSLLESPALNNHDINRTIDAGINSTSEADLELPSPSDPVSPSLADRNLIGNSQADTLVDAAADVTSPAISNDNIGFGSSSPSVPLMPDDTFAPPSTTFEPRSPPAPLLPKNSVVPVSPTFVPGSPPAPLLPELNVAAASPVFEARSPPAPLLPNDSIVPGSPKFEPGSPPAPLLPKDTFSPVSSYKSDPPSGSQEFDPTKPPKNFGSFVQEIAKDMMPDFGGASAKPAEEFGSFVKQVATGSMPLNETKGNDSPKPASEFGAFVQEVAKESLLKESVQGGSASNPTVIVDGEDKGGTVAEEWDPRKPPSNFGSFVNDLAKSKMSGDGSNFDSGAGIVDTAPDKQGWEDNSPPSEPYRGDADQANSADIDPSLSTRSTNAYDRAESWDPWKFDVISQTLGKSSRFPSSTLEDFTGSGLEISLGGRSASQDRGTPSSFERAETWDPWKFDVMSQTLGKSTYFPSSYPDEILASEQPLPDFNDSQVGDPSGFGSQAPPDASFDRAKNWDPWKFDVMSQTLGKSTMFPSSSPEDFANTGISSSSTSQGSGSSRDSSTRSSFERAETWDPWKFDVLSQTLGKSNHFPSSAPQDFFSDQQEDSPPPQPGQRMISYEKTETWDPRTFNVLSQTLGKSTSFPAPAPEPPSAPSSEPSWTNDTPQSSANSSSGSFSRAEKWDPWAFDVLKQTLGKSTIFPSSTPQDFSGGVGDGAGGFGNDWFASSQDSRPSSPLGSSSSTYSPQGVFNRPQTVSGTFDPSGSLSGAGKAQSASQGSSTSWDSGSSSASSGSIADYAQPNGVFDPTSQSGVTSYLQDATRAHFGNAPPSADEDSFPVQNSQFSGDYSESRFKILTGEAAPLHWDPDRETWVEQGTGKPVEATSKSKIAPPKKQEQVSVKSSVGSQQQQQQQTQEDIQSNQQYSTSSQSQSGSDPQKGANMDRKKFFADLFEQDSKSSDMQAPSATVYNGDTSREAIFGRVDQLSSAKKPNQSSRPKATSTKAMKEDESRSTGSRSTSGSKWEENIIGSSNNVAEQKQRKRGDQHGGETYRNNNNRQEIFTEFLRSNYQPGSLRLDIPENIFGVPPPARESDYIDNTANRGFGPFQGGWGRPPQFKENPAENVFIDLPSEEEQRQMPSSSSVYGESPPQFERNGLSSDLYGDAPPFQPDVPRYDEENQREPYRDDFPGGLPDSLPPPREDVGEDFRDRFASKDDTQSSSWQNGGSYLDSMKRSGDDEPNGSSGVFDWGSYVSEERNDEASSSPPPDFPEEDPGGYYIANPTLYDSGFDDYPPVISFAEASRPQMRSYLDSLYKSSQTNGYWDSSSSEQSDSFSESQERSSSLEPPEQESQLFESQQQSSLYDLGGPSLGQPSSFSAQDESSTQTTPYFTSTEWNPKEGADPNQNPFARYVYTDPDLQASRSSPDVSSGDTSFSNINGASNDDKYTGSNSEDEPPTPKRGSQVYPEVKNSWFGGGSYLDSMSQQSWDDGKSS